MTKQALATLALSLSFSFSAFAGNNPRIDQALKENLAEKQAITAELHKSQTSASKAELNSRYRAVEVFETGDELGGFASSKGLVKEPVNKAVEELE